MNRLRDTASRWLAEGKPVCVVSIERTQGSAPREAGTRMLVSAQAVAGTIGGGHLEWLAIREARVRLATSVQSGSPIQVCGERHALGPSLGQCCGGVVWLAYRTLEPTLIAQWPDEVPRLSVAVFGAGHVGQALVGLLASLPCRIHWFDERAEADPGLGLAAPAEDLSPRRAPNLADRLPRCLAADDPAGELADLPSGSCVLIMTHSHAQDFEICEAALRREDLPFVGLIGSATKAARFRHRLLARGLPVSALDRLVCPIGLPGIASKQPEVIALAVAAQLMSLESVMTAGQPVLA